MCPVCQVRPVAVGVLCEDCRDDLPVPAQIMPEQLQLEVRDPSSAALVDYWGRPHRLAPSTLIGRHVDGRGLAILEPSISRNHARLIFDGATWVLYDLGSANGSFVDDRPVDHATRLDDRVSVRFGQVAFYFLADAARLAMPRATAMATAMIPRLAPRARLASCGDDDDGDDAFGAERTAIGLPRMSIHLHEPTGGGGGFVELEGRQVQLTATQFELMSVLVRRMITEVEQPELVRGFVRSSELIAALSWDTHGPNENHVKQLIRRVRRALIRAELGDLIESRHRFGYRLRAVPRRD